MVHKRCRSEVIGPLWSLNRPMALALSASMPSGDPVIVDLRSRLLDLVGRKPLPIRNRTLSTTVFNIDTYPRPWPANSIYVGHGPRRPGLNPSPWGSPSLSCESLSCCKSTQFLEYGRRRADALLWLSPLINQNLICHCRETNVMHTTSLS